MASSWFPLPYETSLYSMWEIGESGEKSYNMSEFADAAMSKQSLEELIAEFEKLAVLKTTNSPGRYMATSSPTQPPPMVAQADEIIDGPVLTDILERLRRLEKAVAELLVKENHRILTP